MPRETIEQTVLEQWRGVNQRLQPTIVPDGFFTFAKGVYFGLGDNATRVAGKTVTYKFSSPIYNIVAWGPFAILQLEDSVAMLTSPEQEVGPS